MRFTTGAILRVTVAATIIKSLCRGLGRNTSLPKRAMSKRAVDDAIISMAQQARPKVIGQMADLRAQLNTQATVESRKFFSNRFSIQDIYGPRCPLNNTRLSFFRAPTVSDYGH